MATKKPVPKKAVAKKAPAKKAPAKRAAAKKQPSMKTNYEKKPAETIRQLAAVHNLDKSDIESEVYLDRPLIAETDLAVTVQELVKAGKFSEAAMAIEIAVRRAYQVEGAA